MDMLSTRRLHTRAERSTFPRRSYPSGLDLDRIMAEGETITEGHKIWRGIKDQEELARVFLAVRQVWRTGRNQDRLVKYSDGSYAYEARDGHYTGILEDWDGQVILGVSIRMLERNYPIGCEVEGFLGRDEEYVCGIVIGHGPKRLKLREHNGNRIWTIPWQMVPDYLEVTV